MPYFAHYHRPDAVLRKTFAGILHYIIKTQNTNRKTFVAPFTAVTKKQRGDADHHTKKRILADQTKQTGQLRTALVSCPLLSIMTGRATAYSRHRDSEGGSAKQGLPVWPRYAIGIVTLCLSPIFTSYSLYIFQLFVPVLILSSFHWVSLRIYLRR